MANLSVLHPPCPYADASFEAFNTRVVRSVDQINPERYIASLGPTFRLGKIHRNNF